MEDFARALADFVRDNQAWAAPIVLVLAFGESLAFVSLLSQAFELRGAPVVGWIQDLSAADP
jgi:hypothetical protein